MRNAIRLSLGLVVIALACGACSESEKPEQAAKPMLSVFEADAGQDGSASDRNDFEADELPVIVSAVFEPEKPVGGERFRVVPRVDGGTNSIRFEWQLNGVSVGSNAAEIAMPSLSKGDEIGVRMTPFRGGIEGETFEVSERASNPRPMIVGLAIESVDDPDEGLGSAEHWRAVVEVGDPDNQSVSIEYRWFVNGIESDDEEDTIRVQHLSRGDTIAVHVRATDGEFWSPSAKSGEISIGNTPPNIISSPPSLGANGTFRYIVRAADGDSDDRLEYSLRKAPRGMRVSDFDGIVTWLPDEEQAGRHEIELVVSDGNGGEAVQSFVLSLVATAAAPPAAPN